MTARCPVCGCRKIKCGIYSEIRPHVDGIGKPCMGAGLAFALARWSL